MHMPLAPMYVALAPMYVALAWTACCMDFDFGLQYRIAITKCMDGAVGTPPTNTQPCCVPIPNSLYTFAPRVVSMPSAIVTKCLQQ